MPDDPINLLFRRVKAMHHSSGPWPTTHATADLLGQWFAELGYDIDGPASQRPPATQPAQTGWPRVDEARAAQLTRT